MSFVPSGYCLGVNFACRLLGIGLGYEPCCHFDARQFYDYSLLGFSLRCALHRNSNIHNPKIGSSCFAKAKHFGAQNAARHRVSIG